MTMLLPVLLSALAALEPQAIDHAHLSCVPIDRYARITARTSAPAAGAELHFRAGAGGPWYSVRMAAGTDGEWAAHLPRPTAALRGLEYRIVVTGRDAMTTATPPVAARVARDCDPAAPTSVEASLVVTVPKGAPLVPPVPAGFSPAGAVAAEQRQSLSAGRKIAGAIAGAAVLGATGVAFAGASRESDPGTFDIPEFRFNGTTPNPGTDVRPNFQRVSILMAMDRLPTNILQLLWGAEFRNAEGRTCLTMGGFLTITGGPLDFELTGPLIATAGGGCGPQFETETIRLSISRSGDPVYDETHALPFRFRP